MNELQTFDLNALQVHPWQVNVPDIQGQEWEAFLADIKRRDVLEPIRVSLRTGQPVIVDGHQRHRAALKLNLSTLVGIVQDFADEAAEVEFLSGAARFRRHLTDAQRVTLARAREAYFKPLAAERKGGRPRKDENLGSNEPRFPAFSDERKSSAQAAAAVGLSDSTFKRGKVIQDEAPAPVVEAWASEQVSTNAAYELTRKAPEIMREAITERRVGILDAVGVNRNPELSKAVESGEKTPEQAVSVYRSLKAATDRDDKERGTALCIKTEGLLTSLEDFCKDDYFKVLMSRYNAEEWDGAFAARWQNLIRQMQGVARAGEVKAQTINVEALN